MENKSILVVDDEQGYRDLYQYTLSDYNFHVHTAENGYQALHIMQEHKFDLVFLDIHMPGLNGYETLKRMKEFNPTTKVIIFTSSSDITYALENKALELGALNCLYKPVDLNEILKIIHDI